MTGGKEAFAGITGTLQGVIFVLKLSQKLVELFVMRAVYVVSELRPSSSTGDRERNYKWQLTS